ncbi:hypothetical protein T439DRAFT_376957 [Meredithblackwellia eburnea MCA 4105]
MVHKRTSSHSDTDTTDSKSDDRRKAPSSSFRRSSNRSHLHAHSGSDVHIRNREKRRSSSESGGSSTSSSSSGSDSEDDGKDSEDEPLHRRRGHGKSSASMNKARDLRTSTIIEVVLGILLAILFIGGVYAIYSHFKYSRPSSGSTTSSPVSSAIATSSPASSGSPVKQSSSEKSASTSGTPTKPSTSGSSSGSTKTQTGSAKTVTATLTGYGYSSNSPPGPTCYSNKCSTEGEGTWDSPGTFASDDNEFADGTMVYINGLQRYLTKWDSCEKCSEDWQSKQYHLDLWMGASDSASGGEEALLACISKKIPSPGTVVINPPSGLPVKSGAMLDSNGRSCPSRDLPVTLAALLLGRKPEQVGPSRYCTATAGPLESSPFQPFWNSIEIFSTLGAPLLIQRKRYRLSSQQEYLLPPLSRRTQHTIALDFAFLTLTILRQFSLVSSHQGPAKGNRTILLASRPTHTPSNYHFAMFRPTLLLLLIAAFSSLVAADGMRLYKDRSLTNGERFKRGLGPLAPEGFAKRSVAGATRTIPEPAHKRLVRRQAISSLLPNACFPAFTLNTVAENVFNPTNVAFSVTSLCGNIDPTSIAVTANGNTVAATAGDSLTINIPGQSSSNLYDYKIYALTTSGAPLLADYQLSFGSISQLISVVDVNGSPVIGATVELTATIYGITETSTTDANGQTRFSNVPSTSLSVLVTTSDNQLRTAGFFAGATVTVHTLPFGSTGPHGKRSFELDLSERSVNERIEPEGFYEKRGMSVAPEMQLKRRQTTTTNDYGSFVVDTNSKPTVQTTSQLITIPIGVTGTKAFLTYVFTTSEFPGGFYGSKFNDYWGITIRTNLGQLASYAGAMNSFPKDQFTSDGSLPASTVSLDITGATQVEFDVGVSNVGDSAYQSHVTVSSYGDTVCGQCPQDPICADACQNPVGDSCTFYDTCAEAKIPCGKLGFNTFTGKQFCLKFVSNIAKVDTAGATYLKNAMSCIQKSILPALSCTGTCAQITAIGTLQSHSDCYADGQGACSLSPDDFAAIVPTISSSSNNLASFTAAWKGGNVCAAGSINALFTKFDTEIAATTGTTQSALKVAKSFLQSIS